MLIKLFLKHLKLISPRYYLHACVFYQQTFHSLSETWRSEKDGGLKIFAVYATLSFSFCSLIHIHIRKGFCALRAYYS